VQLRRDLKVFTEEVIVEHRQIVRALQRALRASRAQLGPDDGPTLEDCRELCRGAGVCICI
jgi:hypothetical protein